MPLAAQVAEDAAHRPPGRSHTRRVPSRRPVPAAPDHAAVRRVCWPGARSATRFAPPPDPRDALAPLPYPWHTCLIYETVVPPVDEETTTRLLRGSTAAYRRVESVNGGIVVGSLRAECASIDALPAGLARSAQIRLAALPRGHDRDVYPWDAVGRGHKAAEPDCAPFATTAQPQT